MTEKILKEYRDMVDKRIRELFPLSDPDYTETAEAGRYSLLLGGKRIRPVLMLEFCKLFGGKTETALDFAVALEMIHTYSLIHDDLPCMDNDDMRRGKPSCHKAFGEDIALLAGDALLTKAFSVAAKADVPADRKVKAIEILSDHAGIDGMIGGQTMDLAFEKSSPSRELIEKMYYLKTGCLISAAVEIGSVLAGADEKNLKICKDYAKNLALAFQIIDDILDITGDEAVLGKPVGSDSENGKTTFVSVCGIGNAKSEAEKYTENALCSLELLKGDTSVIKELTKYLLNRNY